MLRGYKLSQDISNDVLKCVYHVIDGGCDEYIGWCEYIGSVGCIDVITPGDKRETFRIFPI